MGFCRRRAQSIGEYAILLAVVAAAFIGMQFYVKRGFQGRLKEASDFVAGSLKNTAGNSVNEMIGNQFEPAYSIRARNFTDEGARLEGAVSGGSRGKIELNKSAMNQIEEVSVLKNTEENTE